MSPVSEESALQALTQIGGKGTFTHIAKALNEPTRGRRSEPLKEILKQLVAKEKIVLKGSTYRMNSDVPKTVDLRINPDISIKTPAEVHADKIIEAIEKLKRDFKYPAAPKEIAESCGFKLDSQFKALLASLANGSVLQVLKSGKTLKYIIAADDPRYARKATEGLKFELLEEIRNLRCELELLRAASGAGAVISGPRPDPIEPAQKPVPSDIIESILPAVKKISKKKKRRTVLIVDLRTELPDLDSKTFEAALETLGADRRLELQLLQDGTKLDEKQKQGLLRLSDGRLIASVAISEE